MSSNRKKLSDKSTKLSNPRKTTIEHPANLNYYEDGEFRKLPIGNILPDPNQPRQTIDQKSLNELSESIKNHGILQPIVVRQGQDNKMIIIAGERRFRAAQIAELEEIPAIIKKNVKHEELTLIENIQREDLTPIEEAEAYHRLIKKYDYNQEDLAKIIGKARSTVTNILGLTRLPDEIKKGCSRANIPKRTLIEIAKQKTPDDMLLLYEKVINFNLTSDDVRKKRKKDNNEPIEPPALKVVRKIDTINRAILKLILGEVSDEEKKLLVKAHSNFNKVMLDILGIQ